MILGALLDAGLPLGALQEELDHLNVGGFALQTNRVVRQGISATHVNVVTEETNVHRHLHHIVEILDNSSLTPQVKEDSKRIFTRLAEAEAAVHNRTIEHIHFHEVGALDAIVDIVGAVAGLRKLGIETIYVSPFSLGTGFTVCAHGKIPVPVPATVGLLQGKPVRHTDIEAELVTPTGAAILSTLGEHFGAPPEIRFTAIGYGAGTRELSIPNVLRLQIGDVAEKSAHEADAITVLETNIDDMNPQFYDYLFEQLYQAGALEVYTTAVMMKKNRPGILLSVLAPSELRDNLVDILLKETTTIGVRWQDVQRAKAQREILRAETEYGPVSVKVSRLGELVVNIQPEYDDCKRLALEHPGVAFKQIYQAAYEQGRSLVYTK